jgi:hypothetical protein
MKLYFDACCLNRLGFSGFYTLHLACAESAHVDVFLTADDRLLRRAQREVGPPHISQKTANILRSPVSLDLCTKARPSGMQNAI